MSRALLLAVTFTFATFSASASVHHWFGTANNRISDPANWSGGAPVDDPDAELVFDSATVRRDIHILDRGYEIANVVFAPGEQRKRISPFDSTRIDTASS